MARKLVYMCYRHVGETVGAFARESQGQLLLLPQQSGRALEQQFAHKSLFVIDINIEIDNLLLERSKTELSMVQCFIGPWRYLAT